VKSVSTSDNFSLLPSLLEESKKIGMCPPRGMKLKPEPGTISALQFVYPDTESERKSNFSLT